jgi:hypothetical protein
MDSDTSSSKYYLDDESSESSSDSEDNSSLEDSYDESVAIEHGVVKVKTPIRSSND